LEKDGQLTNFEMLRLSDMISHLTASFGASERIKNTPFPLPYSYFTSILVHLFALMVPFGMAELGLLTVPVSIAVIFIFLAIEQIAIEIQDPFANRENDIPVIALSKIIEIDLKEMLGDIVLPSRRQPRDGILM
jgi:putative membrane protein